MDGVGEAAILHETLGARFLLPGRLVTPTAQLVSNPFAAATRHAERDASGQVDLGWAGNALVYAVADREPLAPPLEPNIRTLIQKANHAVMYAKLNCLAVELLPQRGVLD